MAKRPPKLEAPTSTVSLAQQKANATKLLSTFLGSILAERTEVEIIEADGMPMLVTKGEKLARTMVKMALGYTEVRERISDGKQVKDEIIHPPNPGMIALIYDRIEGKIPAPKEAVEAGRTVTTRVSEEGKKRINAAGKLNIGTKTPTT